MPIEFNYFERHMTIDEARLNNELEKNNVIHLDIWDILNESLPHRRCNDFFLLLIHNFYYSKNVFVSTSKYFQVFWPI